MRRKKGGCKATFMQDYIPESERPEIAERLHNIVDRMLQPFDKKSSRQGMNALVPNPTPFDISKENFHDSKAEFQAELKRVETSIKAISTLLDQLFPDTDQATEKTQAEQLRNALSLSMRWSTRQYPLDSASNLIRKNVAETDGTMLTLLICLDFQRTLVERRNLLDEQKKLYWSLPHRAPDYYARAIALRLARLFAKETGTRPTVGTSGETGEPSTSYARALSEVFEVLDISTGTRSPAEWAVQQITEGDLRPWNALAFLNRLGPSPESVDPSQTLGGLLGLDPFKSPDV